MTARTPELVARATAIYERAGYRCCSAPEFVVWYVGAQDVGVLGNFYTKAFDPGSAAEFCLACHPLAQQELAAQGRCVRMDMADPGARERGRRFRERQKAAASGVAP